MNREDSTWARAEINLQTNDEETRVDFMIYAGKYVDGSGQWVPDWSMVTRCRQLAEGMAAELQRILQDHRVPESTMEQRRRLAAQQQP